MLEHKYKHSILHQNQFNTINIKFKLRILEEWMKIWIPKYGFHTYGKKELFLATLRNLVLSQ